MGAEPYCYFIEFQPDLEAALEALRQREFAAGRYNPVVPFPPEDILIESDAEAPGAQHESIAAAVRAAGADGTRSILDITRLSLEPISEEAAPEDFEAWIAYALGTSFPLSAGALDQIFGTPKPTREEIEAVLLWEEMREGMADEFWDGIDRGSGRYVIVYEQGRPSEIFFAGYSFD